MKSKSWRISIIALTGLIFLASKCTGSYINGHYKGISRSLYMEEYYGNASIAVKNGWINRIDFCVRDSAKHELFDASYEHYFTGNNLYIQQCRNDLKGVNSYPDSPS